MYVIFPADQLISMTYGIAVPRFPQRPTLDNLREPQIPIGNRSFPIPDPSSSSINVTETRTTPTTKGKLINNNLSVILQKQQQQLEEIKLPDINIKRLSRQNSSNKPISIVTKDSNNQLLKNKNSTNKTNLLLQQNQQQDKKPLTPIIQNRSRENSLNKTKTLRKFSENNSVQFLLENNDRMNDYLEEDYMRERSPSIILEPPTPNPNNSNNYYQNRPPQFSSNQSNQSNHSKSTPNSPKSVISSKSKLRPKLNISLGRLGRSQPDQSESIRLRDEIKLHVENPTFTKENLRQRNFDAFFEAGVSKYSIEHHQRTPNTPSDDYYGGGAPSLGSGSTFDGGGSGSHTQNTNKNRIGLFSRALNRTPISSVRSRSADCDPARDNTADVPQKDFSTKSSTGAKGRSLFGWRGARSGSLGPPAIMASYSGVLKDYGQSNLNETFKTHNGVTFKLVKTVSDFTETLSRLYEEHATALQTLVSTFRKKNGELRKERPACPSSLFQAWETFLQEIEADSQASSDVASTLSRQVSRPMLDRSFHRKVQSRKIFTHRESFETIIAKTEDKLSKCRMDYKQSYMAHRQNPSQHTLTEYVDSHNAYVQQLHATNGMLEAYHCETIPQLMQELEEIYTDLCSIVAEAVLQGSEIISSKAAEQSKRYNLLSTQCQTMSPQQDLSNLVRILPATQQKVPKRAFAPPQPQNEGDDITDDNSLPQLRNELVIDRHSSIQLRSALDILKRESADLEIQIRQLQDSVDTLIRTQTRGIENQLYNKANELQEDLSMKKFDLRAKQLHLTALRAQKELFLPKSDPVSPQHGGGKFTPASTPSMKTKWLKAFRSLKPASGSSGQPDRRNGAAGNQPLRPNEDGSHNLSEYTYKKITPCDVCSQILRGHTRQGLRCRICKLNAHADCAPQLQATKCQAKQKLLRRQKSTSELENRVDVEEEKITDIDQIYRVLKQAGEIKSSSEKFKATALKLQQQQKQQKNVDTNQTQPQQLNTQLQDNIPIVNVPECPERRTIPGPPLLSRSGGNRGPTYKPPPTSIGGSGKSGGLTAPTIQDVSSSGLQQTITTTTTTATSVTGTTSGSGNETGLRRRLFAGFRPLSGFGRGRNRAPQHRSISLPETPHSPRRQKLNLRMKSLSLDSPESSELHGQMRRRQPTTGPSTSYYQGGGSGGQLEHTTPPSNNSRLHSPSSPSHQRKLLYANRGLKTGSVDLPDDIEKSLSSASTSPCPSPVRKFQKSHRLLPTNLYVILYNFKARHGDELDLKAGYKVTVIDTSDPDWWKGKILGRLGYFPSKYCARLNAGEKPLQVTHNLQVSDGERGENMNLLRDQIVIQIGEELNGMVLVRSADNRQGYCPIKYLQEV